jgi:hypothetical protein
MRWLAPFMRNRTPVPRPGGRYLGYQAPAQTQRGEFVGGPLGLVVARCHAVTWSGWALDELPVAEGGTDADEGHEVGALAARRRTDSMGLKAMAKPAAWLPGPLVARARWRTVGEG